MILMSRRSLLGRKYTWSNERRSPTLVRLDRVFCSSDWEDIFPDSLLQSAASVVSDHCPLVLGLCQHLRQVPISF
uniref:Endonuclease/exonuclease/phosphatase domain-containing protein n=1 Tax=Arundo donax TaxID=35708 RepID=A0A0A9CA11_ARUDO